jgi:DNA-binding response OmpR family regulator
MADHANPEAATAHAATDAVICVIEDDAQVRGTLAELLKSAGFAVVTAADGELGLEAIKTSGARLAISDIVMPNREGIETIREIKQRFPAVRIIAMSGGGSRSDSVDFLELALAMGADDVMAKPFRRAELIAKVTKQLAA